MEKRTTKAFTTTNGHTVVALDYITGREARDIKDFMDKSKQTDGDASTNKISDQAFSVIIKMLDGSGNDIVSRILDLPLVDYSEISDEVSSVLTPKKK